MALYIMTLLGTGGDILPGLAIARELQQRGHQVQVLSYDYFEAEIKQAGLSFVAIGSSEYYLGQITQASFWERHGTSKGLDENGYLRLAMRPVFDYIAQQLDQQPHIICTRNAYGARFAAEKFGLPSLCLAFAPTQFASPEHFPASNPRLARLPLWLRKISLELGEVLYNRPLLPKINSLRASLELPPIRHVRNWSFFQHPSLALFPAWYDDVSQLSPHIYQSDFVFYQQNDGAALAPPLEAFLQAGSAPVLCSFGTGIAHLEQVFARAAKALRKSGRRAIFATKFEQNIPPNLGPDVLVIKHADFSALLPRVALIVHHGGIGTAAQALRAGIPQLIIPQAFDQPDNAHILQRLELAELIAQPDFSEDLLHTKIEQAITQHNQAKLARLSQLLQKSQAAAQAATLCETHFAASFAHLPPAQAKQAKPPKGYQYNE